MEFMNVFLFLVQDILFARHVYPLAPSCRGMNGQAWFLQG